ncbi:MAG: RNA polymerase-binding protein DksA, partial [Lactobacillales bacterium]|jgi:DnaK suppressor protein|nr:RNA polymerase-binding protein DksA [Lactobacillales bacterium]
MNDKQLEYFRQKLLTMKAEILHESEVTLSDLKENSLQESDMNDRASSETDQLLEIKNRDRMDKLLKKIDFALQRIEDKTYGFCAETGEPIGLKRLEARPVTTLSIEAQERHERAQMLGTNE